ncbi:urease accessory protein UreD [Phyllobacterium sp. SYP-B3895]|uniref:urease accessory protein UreD n=1 Tax=Phyllobacterium sp. SYP-B3895 TaxID=2663240 RepID=UPI0012996AF5|nr:urease accessory protein UreD [Phyllobacterium sp. SYP-B3895]MRG56328.1 urease accessory protein UreD [Phyllobacterium sp. SYP-B3895]
MNLHSSPDIVAAAPQRAYGAARLSVKHVNGRTRIASLYQEGCAKIRLPERDDHGLEAVMINTSGGLTGGDRMRWEFDVAENCRAQITTQACERIYRASADTADVETKLRVGEGASLAWLPQETIVFEKSALRRSLNISLAGTSRALIIEPIVFGRKAMGENIETATIHDRWRIWRDNRLVHAEDFRLGPDAGSMLRQPALLGGARAMATVLLLGADAERHLDAARKIIGAKGGASFWSGKLLARLIDGDAYNLRKRLVPLIELLNEEAGVPKVWAI